MVYISKNRGGGEANHKMKNVTLLVAMICASLILRPASGSAISPYDESTSSVEVGSIDAIRQGEHECMPRICCPQFHTCLWYYTQFYCCMKPNGEKWTRKMPAYAC
ncbi:uncharacterized protein [Halyomorpha halys]|uniref:uncharacterized protein n=1 Tax=Halyomorpha halys TaxID=286706 RepID=UPI0034D1DC64